MHDVAVVIFHIEINMAVRIGPKEFRHRCLLEFNYLIRVRHISVMSERRAADSQKANAPNEQHEQRGFHSKLAKLKGDPGRI
jgi:hypothetical protein